MMDKATGFGIVVAMCALASPAFASAQIVISEVMYDPSGSDSGREWIELANTGGSDVGLVGGTVKGSWRISDGSNHTLTDPSSGTGRGSLVVPAGGYLIIANNPANFESGGDYPGGSYSVIKSSISLTNAGGTISLIDGNGATIDSISYTSDLGGSGDGNSLIRSASGTFVPGTPTPGAANTPASSAGTDGTDTKAAGADSASTAPKTDTATQSSSAVSSLVFPVEPQIFAYAGSDRTVIVGADTEFDGQAFAKDGTPITGTPIRFNWNFGDGATAEGEAVLHHWSHPGRYVVALNIAEDKYAAEHTITITAEPARIGISTLPDGSIVLANDAGRTLDLSGWWLRMAGKVFRIPDHSRFLADTSVAFDPGITGLKVITHPAALLYPSGEVAVIEGAEPSSVAPAAAALPGVPAATASKQQSASGGTSLIGTVMPAHAPKPQAAAEIVSEPAQDAPVAPFETGSRAASSSAVAAAAASGAPFSPWIIGLAAMTGFGALTAVGLRRRSRTAWDIIDDGEEGM